jgi:soluble lytic murein transglycosylase-like protein
MFDDFISASAAKWNVPPEWIYAVIETESGWDPNAYNAGDPDGARGLMQIIGPTARALGISDLNSLFDPATNIDLGTKLLGLLRTRYGDDFQRVYSAYNSGNPDLWQTSTQVAAHVANALANLAKWSGNSGNAGLLVVLALAVFWLYARNK